MHWFGCLVCGRGHLASHGVAVAVDHALAHVYGAVDANRAMCSAEHAQASPFSFAPRQVWPGLLRVGSIASLSPFLCSAAESFCLCLLAFAVQ